MGKYGLQPTAFLDNLQIHWNHYNNTQGAILKIT